jgi:hypothetical protein
MPKFAVLRRQDAYVDYVAEVEADTAESAAWLANTAPWDHKWEPQGVTAFDAALYVALDADGGEIAGTECGRCA